MTSSEQIKALIRNKSKALNIDANILLRMIIFEFFLEKLAQSKYANQFIIKGGFLVSAITQIKLRTTMDLDVTLKSISIQKEDLTKYIEEIINIPTYANLKMELMSIDVIHESAEYPGLRASIHVFFDGLSESIKIDFSTGDILTQTEIGFKYVTLLDEKHIELKSYNLETILAEKIETILSRGVLNTRMRDFYDVYLLWNLKKSEIDMDLFKQAFLNTSTYRKTLNQIRPNAETIVSAIELDSNMRKLWAIYQTRYPFAKDIEWNRIIDATKSILEVIND